MIFLNRSLFFRDLGIYRRLAREFGRDFDHRFVDEHRHRIEVAGIALQPEPLRFERQRAAASEGVVERREFFRIEQLLGARMVLVLGTG